MSTESLNDVEAYAEVHGLSPREAVRYSWRGWQPKHGRSDFDGEGQKEP